MRAAESEVGRRISRMGSYTIQLKFFCVDVSKLDSSQWNLGVDHVSGTSAHKQMIARRHRHHHMSSTHLIAMPFCFSGVMWQAMAFSANTASGY